MALCKEKNLPPRSALLTHNVQDDSRVRDEKIQEINTKINRLKRPKRAQGPTEAQLLIGSGSSYKDVCSEPTVSQKFSSNNIRAQPKSGARLPPKLHLLSSCLKQTKLQLTSSKRHHPPCIPVRVTRSDPDIIDLCGDEDGDQPEKRLQEAKNQGRGSTTNINEPNTQVQPQIVTQSVIEEAFHSSSSVRIVSQHRDAARSDTRLKFSDQTLEELREHICTQNPNFPVRRFLSLLMKRRCEFENHCSNLGDGNGAPEVPPAGKRKRDVGSRGVERLRKRQRPNPNLISHTERGNPVPPQSGSRLSISRRKGRQKPSSNAEDESGQHENKVLGDDVGGQDVLWTEKYGPRCSGEVVGNSAAVKKLQSWLKEWRRRADVEERRKRREERRMQQESNGLSDCGDFEGDPMTEACSAELCNTMLIHGPVGVGKTAAVYACAHELGFKVFEVNSSSVRSGHLVLSQLRESTQSHQVGAPCTPAAASLSEVLEVTESEFKAPVSLGKDEKPRSAPVSLVLFEEVDVVFDEDVGFLSAIKSLMRTTKRPIILTTTNPSFSRSFKGHFEEIRFSPPSKASVRSFLQCVCAVESARLDPELVDAVMREYKGDVRRGVLQLELWVRSGAGKVRHKLHSRALTCSSYAELESAGCAGLLVDSWRTGRGLLYSNLELFLAPPTSKSSVPVMSDPNGLKNRVAPTFSASDQTRPMKLSRLEPRRKDLETRKLEAVAQFFSIMSFLDSYLVQEEFSDGSGFKSGAKISDGLLDEPREEDEEELMRTLGAERRYEMQAVLEGLGFQRFRTEVCEMKRRRVDGGGRTDKNCAAAGCKTTPWEASVFLKSPDLVPRVLCSKAFRYHGNKTAVITEYLPIIRFMCSVEGERHRNKPGFSHYLEDIGLRLPKSALNPLPS